MKDITSLLSVACLAIALVLSVIGVVTDVRKRKFPNKILLAIMAVGIAYDIMTFGTQMLPNVLMFLGINIAGIFLGGAGIVAPGDTKFMSMSAFFFKWTDMNLLKFIGCFIIASIIVSLFYHIFVFHHGAGYLVRSLKLQLKEMLIFSQTRVRTSKTYKEATEKDNTIPFTVAILLTDIIAFAVISLPSLLK